MKRFHLFEIHEQPWMPEIFRSLVTDFLYTNTSISGTYLPVVPIIKTVMDRFGYTQIIDLCSGSSGPLLQIQNQLKIKYNFSVSVKLTDKFPNIKSFQRVQKLSNGSIDFCVEPIDATSVSSNLKGFRTLFTSFHHFKPGNAKKILQDAVSQKVAIGIFEMTERNLCRIFMGLLIPFHVLLMTPFVRPFKWSRFFLTYFIPIAPFISLWDGIVSHLRTYSLEELDTLISEINSIGYVWEKGQIKSKRPWMKITYIVGHPALK